jgi:hypothetical protein
MVILAPAETDAEQFLNSETEILSLGIVYSWRPDFEMLELLRLGSSQIQLGESSHRYLLTEYEPTVDGR